MPPRSRGTRGRGRAAPDFTARDVVLDELRKKEHHGSSRVRAALKRAKTFDEAKLRRRRRDDEGEGAGEEGRLDEAIVATKRVDIDALAKRCARACAMRVEKMLDAAFERDGDAAARGNGNGNGADAKSSFATRAIDLGDGFDCGDLLREMCDDAASVGGGEAVADVVGESAYVAAVRRLLRASATRKETDALRERLLAVVGRMNRAVVGKQKREELSLIHI